MHKFQGKAVSQTCIYLEGPSEHFATKRSDRGNNNKTGSVPQTQVKAMFTFGWAKGQYAQA